MIARAVLCFVALPLLVTPARSETELEKFTAAQPKQLRMEFLDYQACSLLTGSKIWDHASFEEAEREIAKECKKHLPYRADQPARGAAIEHFARLALAERRLRYERKPIPGYEPDPITAAMLQCTKDNRKSMDDVSDCFAEHLPLFARSNEPAETVATAVEGVCEGALLQHRRQLAKCINPEQSERLSAILVSRLKTQIISAIVKLRVMPP